MPSGFTINSKKFFLSRMRVFTDKTTASRLLFFLRQFDPHSSNYTEFDVPHSFDMRNILQAGSFIWILEKNGMGEVIIRSKTCVSVLDMRILKDLQKHYTVGYFF